MIRLDRALQVWGTPRFNDVLKNEIEAIDPGLLPLQQGLTATSYARQKSVSAMVINATEEAQVVHAKVGIFFSGIIAGSCCADDPTPVEDQNEYCVMRFDIDKRSAETSVVVVDQ